MTWLISCPNQPLNIVIIIVTAGNGRPCIFGYKGLEGHTLDDITDSSLDQCTERCDDNSACKGATYNSPTHACTLHSEIRSTDFFARIDTYLYAKNCWQVFTLIIRLVVILQFPMDIPNWDSIGIIRLGVETIDPCFCTQTRLEDSTWLFIQTLIYPFASFSECTYGTYEHGTSQFAVVFFIGE